MPTATIARIRRCNRESEFAVAQDASVVAARPDARPAGGESFIVDSFFDITAHAQTMLNERFVIQSSNRLNEAAERQEPLGIGTDIPVAPFLPRARLIDRTRGMDRTMLVKGIAIDFQVDRNSAEAVG